MKLPQVPWVAEGVAVGGACAGDELTIFQVLNVLFDGELGLLIYLDLPIVFCSFSILCFQV